MTKSDKVNVTKIRHKPNFKNVTKPQTCISYKLFENLYKLQTFLSKTSGYKNYSLLFIGAVQFQLFSPCLSGKENVIQNRVCLQWRSTWGSISLSFLEAFSFYFCDFFSFTFLNLEGFWLRVWILKK